MKRILITCRIGFITNSEQSRALELDQIEEDKHKEGSVITCISIDKFDTSKTGPNILCLESGILYLQGCQLYVE